MSRILEWTEDRVERVRRLAADGHTDRAIAVEMGVLRSAIIGMRWRNKIPVKERGVVAESPPADFVEIGPTLGIRAATKHYCACADTIRAWHRLCGTEAKKRVRVHKPYVPKPRQPKAVVARAVILPRAWARPAGMTPIPSVPMRDDTLAAQAQFHLQRLYPVYRANVRDPNAPHDSWIVNGRRVDESELIRIAQRRGLKVAA